jgi:hypothetical protein
LEAVDNSHYDEYMRLIDAGERSDEDEEDDDDADEQQQQSALVLVHVHIFFDVDPRRNYHRN